MVSCPLFRHKCCAICTTLDTCIHGKGRQTMCADIRQMLDDPILLFLVLNKINKEKENDQAKNS